MVPSTTTTAPVRAQAPQPAGSPGDETEPRRREHYIPLLMTELVHLLLTDPALDETQRAALERVYRLLEMLLHARFHRRLEELKRLYVPFDPDAPVQARTFQRRTGHGDVESLIEPFCRLLESANYYELDRGAIENALGVASDWGIPLDLDLGRFAQLKVYARGDMFRRRHRRRLRSGFRLEQIRLPVYHRLVVLFQPGTELACHTYYASAEHVYLKMFKNVPHMDLDMLLPGSRVRITLIDRGKILLPTLSGLAVAGYNVVRGVVVFTVAGIYGLLALLAFIAATLGYGVRSFIGYLRTKDRYHLRLTRSLYYQNLDNNAGVLFRVLDEAEEQEFCETALGYFILLLAGGQHLSLAEVDRRAEQWLMDRAGLDVDFQIEETERKLLDFGLAQSNGNGIRALGLTEAEHWLHTRWLRKADQGTWEPTNPLSPDWSPHGSDQNAAD